MAVISKNQNSDDPLLPYLWSVEKSLKEPTSINGRDLHELCSNCITTFKNNPRYQNDMDSSSDHESIYREIEQNKICLFNSLLYETYALFLEAKGRLIDAFLVYHLGISRNAEPLGRLKKAQVLFLERMSEKVTTGSLQKVGPFGKLKTMLVINQAMMYFLREVITNEEQIRKKKKE
ncbi:hypothetical protein FXO37_21960 [Capsicum annuum]|nr:hypothetical protein FXO37_21960 [Capsicum annuum]